MQINHLSSTAMVRHKKMRLTSKLLRFLFLLHCFEQSFVLQLKEVKLFRGEIKTWNAMHTKTQHLLQPVLTSQDYQISNVKRPCLNNKPTFSHSGMQIYSNQFYLMLIYNNIKLYDEKLFVVIHKVFISLKSP